jgi:hyperosmotically inducible periplasmic protein
MLKTIALSLTLAALSSLGCTTSPPNRPPDDRASDAVITSQVASKLAADLQQDEYEIAVDTQDGVVRLRGGVETEAQRLAVERLAGAIEGVRSVDNQLRVGELAARKSLTDAWLVTKLRSRLAADPAVNAFDIDVDALDGRVTLTGMVSGERAREQAERIAKATEGVSLVRNEIRVR